MINIGFAGTGDHAIRAHFDHLVKMDDCRITGVFDPGDASFAAAQERSAVSLARYVSYEDMIGDPALDAVLISSPDRFHLPQLEAAVAAGKHVFCEKPLCSDAGELKRLADVFALAEEKGLVVTSCHPRRTDPPYMWVRDHLPAMKDLYGQVLSVHLDFTYHEPDNAKAGLHADSLLQDHANHELDYVHHLLGPSRTDFLLVHDSADRYELMGAREDGVGIHFTGTRRLAASIYAEAVNVRFDRATLHVDTYDQRNSYLRSHEGIVHQGRGQTAKEDTVLITPGVTDYNQRFVDINRAWLDAIQGRGPNYLEPSEMIANSTISVSMKGRKRFTF